MNGFEKVEVIVNGIKYPARVVSRGHSDEDSTQLNVIIYTSTRSIKPRKQKDGFCRGCHTRYVESFRDGVPHFDCACPPF